MGDERSEPINSSRLGFEMVSELEAIYDNQMTFSGDLTKAKALYDKIILELQSCVTKGTSFNDAGQIEVYTLRAESNNIPVPDAECELYSKNITRINYIRANRVYLEWYFNKQLNQPGYKYFIKIDKIFEDSLIDRKTITILNIVLQRI